MIKGGLNIVGSKRSDGTEREENDFYATDPRAIEDLSKFVNISGSVWENACGDGALAREIKKLSNVKWVYSTDIIDRGYEDFDGVVNFLEIFEPQVYDWIITNPPYKHGLEWVRKSLNYSGNVAVLMKLVFLESAERKKFFEECPPSKVLVYSKRLGVYKNNIKTTNSGLVAYAWFVWEKGIKRQPEIYWI